MTERKLFTCDFNPNTPAHASASTLVGRAMLASDADASLVASYRINDGEHESLGLGSKDACVKHLPNMVAVAVDRLHSNDRVCITRLPDTPEPVRSTSPHRGTGVTVNCPRCDKQMKSVSGYI